MKIDNSVNPLGGPPGNSRNGATKASADSSAAASSASTDGSGLSLSPLSARLQAVSASMANTPAVDAGRVAQIKQAIAEGQFQVNPGKIADGLIASVRQMLSKG